MALSPFTAQQAVSAGSSGHIADHNEIRSQIQEILDELTLYKTGRRNVIRNGDMGVWQRGVAAVTVQGIFADGWTKENSGGTHTCSQNIGLAGAGFSMNGAPAAIRTVVASQSVAGDFAQVHQRIESVRTLAGKEVTLSFIALATSGTPKIGIECQQHFGTGGTPSADVLTAVSAVTISTTATRYTVTFIVPSIAGKTIGTSGSDYLRINFWVSAGSTYAARASSIGIQNTTIDITDVQLEQGSPTPFERLSQAEQLLWCQRYFWRRTWGASDEAIGPVSTFISTESYLQLPHPVTMRGTPALSWVGAAMFNIFSNGGQTPSTNVLAAASTQSPHVAEFRIVHAAATTGGNFVRTNGAGRYLEASAEL